MDYIGSRAIYIYGHPPRPSRTYSASQAQKPCKLSPKKCHISPPTPEGEAEAAGANLKLLMSKSAIFYPKSRGKFSYFSMISTGCCNQIFLITPGNNILIYMFRGNSHIAPFLFSTTLFSIHTLHHNKTRRKNHLVTNLFNGVRDFYQASPSS